MYVMLRSASEASLEEPDVFTAFKVVVASREAGALRPDDTLSFGRLDPDENHVWIDPDWLRAMGPTNSDWQSKLSGMIAYAETKGWCDPTGAVRAHVEFWVA